MSINGVYGYGAVNPAEGQSSSNDFGKGDFFKLISAQLKYQNPMEPVSDVDFLGQTAQFNLLEQMADLNTGIQNMLYSQESLYANSLIGKEIAWISEDLQQMEGTVEKVAFTSDGIPLLIVDGIGVNVNAIMSVSAPAEDSGSGQDEGEEGSEEQQS